MMDGSAIKELQRINLENIQVERDGMLFSGKNMAPVFYEPRPEPVALHTLSGLVDFVLENVDETDLKKTIITVDDPTRVTFLSACSGYDRKRDSIAVATVDKELKTYKFGEYQAVEFFIVSLRSMFESSPDIDRLISYLSKVRGGKSFELVDDGVTQSATVNIGAAGALTKKETAPAIVKLRPYRTFRDIQQTESEFLFRMKLIDTDENIVGACLYEADGGRWRNFATQAIRDFLHGLLPEGPKVIA